MLEPILGIPRHTAESAPYLHGKRLELYFKNLIWVQYAVQPSLTIEPSNHTLVIQPALTEPNGVAHVQLHGETGSTSTPLLMLVLFIRYMIR